MAENKAKELDRRMIFLNLKQQIRRKSNFTEIQKDALA